MQLALVGSMAHDDPEGWDFYNQTVAYAGGDPDIFILSNLNNVGSVEVNAFQVHSAAVIQKSIREGFGLTVSGGALEGAADGRRAASAASSSRSSTARPAGSSTRRASARTRASRSSRDPERARRTALARQGARAPALPDAAAPPRLARALQPPARRASTASGVERRASRGARASDHRMAASRRKLIVVSNRGPVELRPRRDGDARRAARRRRPRHGARAASSPHHDVTWIASAMSDEDRVVADESRGAAVRGDGARRLAATGCGSSRTTRRRTTGTTTSSRTRCSGSSSTTSGTSRATPDLDDGVPPRVGRGLRARSTAASPTRCSRSSSASPTRPSSSTTTTSTSRRASCASARPDAHARALRAHPVAAAGLLARAAGRDAPRRSTTGCSRTTSSASTRERWRRNFLRSCEDIVGASADCDARHARARGPHGRSRATRSRSTRGEFDELAQSPAGARGRAASSSRRARRS